MISSYGLFHPVGDFEQREILFGNQMPPHEFVDDEAVPGFPVSSPRLIDQYDWHRVALAGLDEREGLEPLVLRAEAPRKEGHGVHLLHEKQLAGEKILEVYELLIVAR